jgi:hypothetical protein
MKVLICGDRNWSNIERVVDKLMELQDRGYTTLIEGEANGADRIAKEAAKVLGFTIEAYPADWQKYGKAAGPIRNRQMLVEGKPDLVVAFHGDLENSRGTKNMVNQAIRANIDVRIITD